LKELRCLHHNFLLVTPMIFANNDLSLYTEMEAGSVEGFLGAPNALSSLEPLECLQARFSSSLLELAVII
jgi:hypothetical protein